MAKPAKSAYEAIKNMINAFGEKRNLSEVLELVTEDVVWIGIGWGENAFGKAELKKILKQEIEVNPTPILPIIYAFEERKQNENTMFGWFLLCFLLQNEGEISMDIQGTFTCVKTDQGVKIASIHTSVPTHLHEEDSCFSESFIEWKLKKELEQATEELSHSAQLYRIAVENANDMCIWEYDVNTKQCSMATRDLEWLVLEGDVPESVIAKGFIHPQSVAEYRRIHQAVVAGEKEAEAEICYLNQEHQREWHRIKYITIFDEEGTPICAVGCSREITGQKLMEARFNEEMAYREQLDRENLAASLRINLTQDRVEAYSKIYDFPKGKLSFDRIFQIIAEGIPDQREEKKYMDYFCRENLLYSFSKGENQLCMEYQRKLRSGKVEWVKTEVKLIQKPYSDDVIAFFYTNNIHEEKLTKTIMHYAITSDYDYIACINGLDESFISYINQTSGAIVLPERGESYTETMRVYINDCVQEEERERALEETSLENVLVHLEKEESFFCYFRGVQKDGAVAYKKLRFSYLNRQAKQLVLSQTDTTHIYEENQRKNEILGEALQAAQQASAAKTDFLSRMSHEIRTPMNAIIGMSTLAAQSMGDAEQLANYIMKIRISSRFLLSLMNDILDMSRIESGKVLLMKEKIHFASFMEGVNEICHSQAQAKNIDFACMVNPNVEDYYTGDTMKLQQILINIISNAIKFTPNGGTVSLFIQQMHRTETDAVLQFLIRDTGCGIAEDFIPKLFEPFSQEHSGITSAYGGTGLGLAICKNFISLMDGKINVRSEVGKGSEFLVELKLGIVEESKQMNVKKMQDPFTKWKGLIVDDEVNSAQHIQKIMDKMGIKSIWVDSGTEAIAQVLKKWEKKEWFDLILLDCNMTKMDGIATAKKIREIIGLDKTIIMLTVEDWVVVEQEAKSAGVNLLINKPIVQSAFISALEKVLYKEEKKEAKKEKEYDFTGKRVLLAEDHPLNVEVARKLLERKGFTVDHAENGLRAVELFSAQSPDYYDVILMDIRMPVMDGLEAAKTIRGSHKEDANTIPIIAMTANAFEDDIEKSKQAGMNMHLAKPIEPKRLFETLYDILETKKNTK